MFAVDDGEQVVRQFGDAPFELQHCRLEFFDVRLGIAEEGLQEVLYVVDSGHVQVEFFTFALVEDGAARVLEDGVGEGVVFLDFFGDLAVKVAFGAFGFPVAAPQVVDIAQHAIGPDAALDGLFVHQRPADLARAVGQQVVEGRAQGEFVAGVTFILFQFFIIAPDGFAERGGVGRG